MMQCPECGTANRLGALFCRSCGAKLEVDSVTKDTFEQVTGVVPKDKMTARKRVRRIIFNVLRLAFLAVVVFGFYLALQIPEVEQPETTTALAEEFNGVRKELLAAVARKRELTKTTTEAAVNSYLAARPATQSKGGTFQLLDTWVLFEDNGDLTWVIETKLLGRPLRFQYRGTVKVKDGGGVTLEPKGFFGARLGKLPYPTVLLSRTVKPAWESLRSHTKGDEANQKILDAITDLKFEGDKITVTVGK